MKKAEVAALSFKILAVYAFIAALVAVNAPILTGTAFRFMPQKDMPQTSMILPILAYIPSLLLFLFSLILWRSGKKMEARASAQAPSEDASGLTPQILQNIAFSILGICILIDAIPHVCDVGMGLVRMIDMKVAVGNGGLDPWGMASLWMRFAETLIRLAIGIWLVVGSKRLREFKSRLLAGVQSAVKKDW